MLHTLFALVLLLYPVLPSKQQTALPITGYATYYNPGIMEKVVVNRERWGQLPDCEDCVGYVAMLWPGDLGRTVCVNAGTGIYGPYQVADVAAGHHRSELIKKDWVLDADRPLWLDWKFKNTPTLVTVQECE